MRHHLSASIFIAILICGFTQPTIAGTLAGAELTYRSLGDNHYEIRYSLFTDYPTSAPSTQSIVEFSSTTCGLSGSSVLLLQEQAGEKIATSCQNSGIALMPSLKRWVFTGIIELPASCNDWKLGVTDCCRNAYSTTVENPELSSIYSTALINNLDGNFDGPVFDRHPDFYLKTGQTNHLNCRISCTSADSVTWSAVAPQAGPEKTVRFLNGRSAKRPLRMNQDLRLDPITGDFCITPLESETGILALKLEAWKNGLLIGSSWREQRITALSQTNDLPRLSGIDGTEKQVINTCAGKPVSFYLFSSDNDAEDAVSITMLDTLAGASFETSGDRHATARFSWMPPNTDVTDKRYLVRFMVKDNSCPMPASQTYTMAIQVKGLGFTASTTPASCKGVQNGTASVAVDPGAGPFDFTWTPGNRTGSTLSGLGAGNYTVRMTNSSGCVAEQVIQIAGKEGIDPGTVTVINASCSNGANGAIFISLPKADDAYDLVWMPSNNHSTAATNLAPGTHSLTITDKETGCTFSKEYQIGYSFLSPTVKLGPDQHACTGSVVQLNPDKEFPASTWQDGSNSPLYLATTSGEYSVLVTDEYGCTGTGRVSVEFASCENQKNPLGEEMVSIFPNPTKNILNINFKEPTRGETKLYVADMLGKIVLNTTTGADISTTTIAVDRLIPGIYLLYIEQGEDAAVYRFVKE